MSVLLISTYVSMYDLETRQVGLTAAWCILATILAPTSYLPYGTVRGPSHAEEFRVLGFGV